MSAADLFWSDEFPPEVRFGFTIADLGQLASTGDFNHDFSVDISDVDLLDQVIAAGRNDAEFDLNHDQQIDQQDRSIWVHELKRHFRDANLDGEFNSRDLVAVFQSGKYERDVKAGVVAWRLEW